MEGSVNVVAVSEVAKTLCVLTVGSEDLRGSGAVDMYRIWW